MKDIKKPVFILISVITIIFPVAYLMGILEARISFPVMFVLLGCQQLYNGLFIASKEDKNSRVISSILGIALLLFGTLIVLPKYYF